MLTLTKEDIQAKIREKLNEALANLHADIMESVLSEAEESCECDDCEDCVDVHYDESTNEYYYEELDEETLAERRIVIRVNSRGQRTKRIKCPPGRIVKTVNGRKVCATPTGRQKLVKKVAIRKSVRTKKAKGAGYKKRTNFKRQRAIKKRRQMGL